MPSHKVHDHKLAEKANELYWHSGRSVNQIAEELDKHLRGAGGIGVL